MASVRTESVSPFDIYEDRDSFSVTAGELLSEQDVSFNSSCDIPISSIENVAPPSPVIEDMSTPSKRRISGMTSTTVSSFPSEMSMQDEETYTGSRYTPMRNRPAFRNPSSVKAMQMSSPQPYSPMSRPQSRRSQQFTTPSRRSATPQSRRSESVASNHLQIQVPPEHHTPVQESEKQRCPLVLLHVNLLPLSLQYPAHLMETFLPSWLLRNFRILEEKLEDPLIMGRGVLIPHPRHEYDLLEERVLESLELASPRLLQCGHYNGRRTEDYGSEIGWDEEDEEDAATETGSNLNDDSEANEDLCQDCERPIRHPDRGVGYGKRKWEVRIYAANGLMRAGAWSAAWSEMERVDVEVVPWIPEDLKRQLQEEVKRLAMSLEMPNGIPTPPVSAPSFSRRQTMIEPTVALEPAQTVRATTQDFVQHEYRSTPDPIDYHRPSAQEPLHETEAVEIPSQRQTIYQEPIHERTDRRNEIPLTTLLRNYFFLLAQDRRNIIMAGMGLLLLFLFARTMQTSMIQELPVSPNETKLLTDFATLSRNSAVIEASISTQPTLSTITEVETQISILTETTTAIETLTSIEVLQHTVTRTIEVPTTPAQLSTENTTVSNFHKFLRDLPDEEYTPLLTETRANKETTCAAVGIPDIFNAQRSCFWTNSA